MNLPEKKSTLNRILAIIPALLTGVLFLSVVSGLDSDQRLVVLRYFLFGFSGLAAFILPYLSFPDRRTSLIQIANLDRASILKWYLRRHSMIWLTGLLLVLVIVSGTPWLSHTEPVVFVLSLATGSLFLTGVYLYAAVRYLKSGADSQLWKEGGKGEGTKRWMAEVGKYPMDPGSIPSLLNSIRISLFGMLAVVAGAAAHGIIGLAGEFLVALAVCMTGLFTLRRVLHSADHHFYHTHSFFHEFFGEGRGLKEGREPIRVDHLWWIPGRWKTHSWAFMLELDRRVPSGRLIGIGHLFLWVLAYQRLEESVLLGVWILFAVLHHTLLIFTTHEPLVPRWWLRHLDRPIHWMVTRFWVQVRWLLPLLVSMIVMKALFGFFQWQEVWFTALVYLGSGALAAAISGAVHERRWT